MNIDKGVQKCNEWISAIYYQYYGRQTVSCTDRFSPVLVSCNISWMAFRIEYWYRHYKRMYKSTRLLQST